MGQLPIFLIAALATHVRGLGDDPNWSLGVLAAVFYGMSALSNVMFGARADRIAIDRILRRGLVWSAIALASTAGFGNNFNVLVVCFALAGASNGAMQPAVNRYLSRAVVMGHRGLAFGVKQAAVPFTTLLSGAALAVASRLFGWQGFFFGSAVVSGLFALGLCRGVVTRVEVDVTAIGRSIRRRMDGHIAGLVVLALGAGTGVAAANSVSTYFVFFALSESISEPRVAAIAVIASATSIGARIIIGWQADRWPGRSNLRIVAGLLGLGACGVGVMSNGSELWVFWGAILTYTCGWGWAGLFNFEVTSRYWAVAGIASGIVGAGVALGASLGPFAFGIAASRIDFDVAWLGVMVCYVTSALLVLLGRMLVMRATAIREVL